MAIGQVWNPVKKEKHGKKKGSCQICASPSITPVCHKCRDKTSTPCESSSSSTSCESSSSTSTPCPPQPCQSSSSSSTSISTSSSECCYCEASSSSSSPPRCPDESSTSTICDKTPPCINVPPYVQIGRLPFFNNTILNKISLAYGICLTAILNIQLMLFTLDDGWIVPGDITYPFSIRMDIAGTLYLILPAGTTIQPFSASRLTIQMADQFVSNETC